LFRSFSKTTADDLWVLSMAGDKKPTPFINTPAREVTGQFSPDGRWIAYVSDESGQQDVSVQPFPPTGAKFMVSVGGGGRPHGAAIARNCSISRRLES
jgi:eukaryotic-like serine/threonine-protein kinase